MFPNYIDIIGFDWDGTLVDSMLTKADSFATVTTDYHPPLDGKKHTIELIYLATRGHLRHKQRSLVEDYFEVEPLSDAEAAAWSDDFTNHYLRSHQPLFDETVPTLQRLQEHYTLFMSSSVYQDDLDKTIQEYNALDSIDFAFVLGTREPDRPTDLPLDNGRFRKGPSHFSYVAEHLGEDLDGFAFVGDGPRDIRAAKQAGCYAVGRADPRISFASLDNDIISFLEANDVAVKSAQEALQSERPDEIVTSLDQLVAR